MYEYEAKVTPFFIRHAIELKVKCEMLGIDRVIRIKKDGTSAKISQKWFGKDILF